MKKIIPYFYILVPLMLLAVYQNNSCSVKQENNNDPIIKKYAEDIIYKLKSSNTQQLKPLQLKREILEIRTATQALSFLDNYLKLSRIQGINIYAGYAISGFHQMKPIIQDDGAVLLKYAELLEFSHQFEKAIEILTTASHQQAYVDAARLRLINIYMIKGNLGKIAIFCNKLKTGELWAVATVCQHWLEGMANNNLQSRHNLKRMADFLYNDKELRVWIYQLLIDLYLNSDMVEQALFTLSKIQHEQSTDLAPFIQILDYLILKSRSHYAADLLEKHDPLNNLKSRRIIINKMNAKELSFLAEMQTQIQLYKDTNEDSKYREVALWEMFVNENPKAAVHYSELNYQLYKTQNDRLLFDLTSNNSFQW